MTVFESCGIFGKIDEQRMRKVFYIVSLIVFQQNLYAQKEIVGKIEFYKSNPSQDRIIQSITDKELDFLNSISHTVKLFQRDSAHYFKTDSAGIFKIVVNPSEKLILWINEDKSLFKKMFSFYPDEIKDSLYLRISDKKFAVYKDSIDSPNFYKKYNEKQAYIDFENNKKQILESGGFISEDSHKRRKNISEKYNVKYNYPEGFRGLASEIRIIFRYNEVMKKLLGIDDLW